MIVRYAANHWHPWLPLCQRINTLLARPLLFDLVTEVYVAGAFCIAELLARRFPWISSKSAARRPATAAVQEVREK